MGNKNHQIQHKERREESRRELAELKKENMQLKRQVARLTKQLAKIVDVQEEKEEKALIETVKDVGIKCFECKSPNIKELKVAHIELWVCKDCGWRKRKI